MKGGRMDELASQTKLVLLLFRWKMLMMAIHRWQAQLKDKLFECRLLFWQIIFLFICYRRRSQESVIFLEMSKYSNQCLKSSSKLTAKHTHVIPLHLFVFQSFFPPRAALFRRKRKILRCRSPYYLHVIIRKTPISFKSDLLTDFIFKLHCL